MRTKKRENITFEETLQASLIIEVDKNKNFKIIKDRYDAFSIDGDQNKHKLDNVIILKKGE